MILSLYFVLWLTLKKLQSVTETKYWHTVFSQLFSFTLRYKLCLWVITLQAVRFYILCVYLIVWTRRSSKCILLVCFGARRACAHTHAHTHTHFSLRISVSRVDFTFDVLLSNMSSNLVTVKTAFYNNRQTIDLILTVQVWSGRNECAPLWREGSCARRNTAYNR